MNDVEFARLPRQPQPWPYVYRITWFRAVEDAQEGGHQAKSWTLRITERGVREWQDIFEGNRQYALQRGRSWNDKLVIERAPVGEWETIYDA